MIQCGACGLSITAEDKTNRFGSHYTYYHCTKRNMERPRCSQPSIRDEILEQQIVAFLESLTVPEDVHRWLASAASDVLNLLAERQSQVSALEKASNNLTKTLENLTHMRLHDMIEDAEFISRRSAFQAERICLTQRLQSLASSPERFEPLEQFILFCNKALKWFALGTPAEKRLIVKITGSNLVLKDKILSIQARKPFRSEWYSSYFPNLRRAVQDVRTADPDPELKETFDDIQKVIERFEPEYFMNKAIKNKMLRAA
jgi:hypothetical protein